MDIEKTLKNLTLEEKASLCSGSDAWHTRPVDRLGVPAVMMADGPHGLRKEISGAKGDILRDSYPATCFPTASAMASTWNRALISRVGQAIAEECLAEQVSVVLGPGANIKRSPVCGRNFEYYSEDPYLSGEFAAAFINGVQAKGVGVSLKHFAVNNQEYRRMLIDAVVDERALREIYLLGFEKAVKQGKPWTVMAAYNKINGNYCTENKWLLDDILRKEWGFEGIVVSDWGAVNDRAGGIVAGLDLEMPGIPNGNTERIIAAIRSGRILESALDDVARRLLQFIARCEPNPQPNFSVDLERNHALAKETAAEAAVLLKNDGQVLPLAKHQKIALIGQFALKPRYQGSGSSLIHPRKLDTLYDAMVDFAGAGQITYADGYTINAEGENEALRAEAVQIAAAADAAVVCVGLTDMDEIESRDRTHMRLPAVHDQLVSAIVKVNPNTIVLLSNGSPVEMPWVDEVPAILEGYLAGEAGACAHCDLIYGRVNPSGKLAETFPKSFEDNPSYAQFPGGPQIVEYRESLYVGYRFYDKVGKEVLFPFGHGLSYSTFAYSELKMSAHDLHVGDELVISFKVKNIGSRSGMETAQIYVRDIESAVFRPEKELKGFEKVYLEPGEDKTVRVVFDKRAFAFYDVSRNDWVVETGEFEILVGASSRDIRLTGTVNVIGEVMKPIETGGWYKHFPIDAQVPRVKFESLLGIRVPENPINPKPYTLNTPIMDMKDSLIGRFLEKIIRKQIDRIVPADMHLPTRIMIEQMALESPLRVLVMFSGGVLNYAVLSALLDIANGNFLRGLGGLLKSRKT